MHLACASRSNPACPWLQGGEDGKSDDGPEEMVLDPQQDEFYRRHMYSNYGEVGVDVQSLLADFQAKNKLFAKVGLQDVGSGSGCFAQVARGFG